MFIKKNQSQDKFKTLKGISQEEEKPVNTSQTHQQSIQNTSTIIKHIQERTSSIYKNLPMHVTRVLSCTAPITVSFFSPFLKRIIVGMLRIPYWVVMSGFSSVLSLKHFSLPSQSFEILLITGWIIRHGPHHVAQNTTRTGVSLSRTRDCHVALATSGTARDGFKVFE